MKKIIYSAAAMVLAFFAASCQQENLEPVATDNTVTYTVEVPGALSTKALGDDATGVDKVYYQVYRDGDVDKLDKPFVYEGEADVDASTGTASFELEFVKGQNYVVLFWAQDADLQMFDIDDFRAVELTTPGASNNVNAQVFAGSNVVTDCVPANGGKVTLSRPISQINIATNEESLQFGTKTIEIKSSTVTVKDLYPVYNVATGEVSGTLAPVTYTDAPIFNETLEVNGVTYTYAAMNYVGFAHRDGTTVEVDFTISTKDDGNVSHTVSSVPVKPNYRTNIIGNLLTEAADYDVTLDAAWDDEEYTEVVVSTAADLQTTVNEAPAGETTEITLSGDINLGDLAALLSTKSTAASNYLTIPAGKSIVLNLNGYSMSAVDETSAAYAMIFNNGNLSIVNTAKDKVSKLIVKATVESGWSRRSAVVSSEPGSTLTVGAGVEIEHLGGTSMAYGIDILTNGSIGDVTVTIDGATVKSAYRAIRQFLNSDSKMNSLTIKKDSEITSTKGNKSVWMQDASAKANKGSLVVVDDAKLMTDAYLDVTAGSTAWPVTVSIAASALKGEATVVAENVPALYDVVLKDGIWKVETSFTFAEFVDAVIAAEGTYDGEGKTVKILPLSGKSDNTNGCLIPNRLQKYSNPDVYYAQYQRFAELQDVNISNVNFVFVPAAITVQDAWNPAGATTTVENVNGELQFMNSGSVTLTGCTFDKVAVSPINAPALTVADCKFNDLQAYAIKDIKAATVSITDTEFNNCNGGFWFANAPATVTVTNNTFTKVGRRGAIQFSANGDYSNTTLNISDNTVDGIFLWQLNETITEAQLKPVLESNTYTTAYVDGSVIPVDVAKIGETTYPTLQSAFNVGGEIVLLCDVVLAETAVLAEGKTVVLDLNGKTLSHNDEQGSYAINNQGTLTLKNGTINARGIYNGYGNGGENNPAARLIIENGYYNAKGENGGAAVFNYGIAEINGGNFSSKGGYSLNNQQGSQMTIAEGVTANNGVYASNAVLTINGGRISGNRSGCHVVYCWNTEATINGGEFYNNNYGNSTVMAAGSTKITYNGGTYGIKDGHTSGNTWTSCLLDSANSAIVVINDGTYNGGFRVQAGTSMEINGGSFNDCYGSAYNIYGAVVVKGGTYTDATAVAFAKKYVAEGYKLNANGQVVETQKSNEIWYVSDEMKLEPTNPDALNANIVSNVWDSKTGKGVITFDAPLTVIGEKAFQRVTNTTPSNWATSISLPEGVESIGNYAFAQCYSLTSINIPDSVTSIGQYAFQSCDAVTSVTIGSCVTSIASGAFYNCYEIKEIICKSTTPPAIADKWVFNGVEKNIKVVVPVASVDTYKAATNWNAFTNIIAE